MARMKSNIRRAMLAELEAEKVLRQQDIAELRGEPVPLAPMPMPRCLDLARPVADNDPKMYSAPPHGTGGRPGVDHAPRKVTLTAEEADMARRCGISYETYAANKLQHQHLKTIDPDKYGGRG